MTRNKMVPDDIRDVVFSFLSIWTVDTKIWETQGDELDLWKKIKKMKLDKMTKDEKVEYILTCFEIEEL